MRRYTATTGTLAVLGATFGFALAPPAGSATPPAPWDPAFSAPADAVSTFGAGTRPLGVAVGDFDGDGKPDMVVGRVASGVAAFTFHHGNGNGTFSSPGTAMPWRLQTHNEWTLAAGDVNGDTKLDLIWGSTATAASSGCTVTGQSTQTGCTTAGGAWLTVNPGDVRYLPGNGDGTFAETTYYVSGVRYAAGTFIARVGATGAGSFAVGDVDNDGDTDIVVGGVDGTTSSAVTLLRNGGGGAGWTASQIVNGPANGSTMGTTVYWPAYTLGVSPWGLAFGDADGDGDLDLWIGDRSLYVYLFKNNGSGTFTVTPGDTVVSGTRPNVYLAHEGYRAATGYTPSLASADLNGDGKADLVLGLQSGGQTTAVAHDGELLVDLSGEGGHAFGGVIGDVGFVARGVAAADLNGDGYVDVVSGEYDGHVRALMQYTPLDSDLDGISDYTDNAPYVANAPRLDMNIDGSINRYDQLDNDFDTTISYPVDPSTRLGDVSDADDDNDGVADAVDNCPLTANSAQADADGDGVGNACDPYDGRDPDSDGIRGISPGDPLYAAAKAAAAKWASASTHFVIRIDALGRWWQSEFTQTLADAALKSDEPSFESACNANYASGSDSDSTYRPNCALMTGGKNVPVTLATIPKLIWTDPTVMSWINARIGNANLEIAQHGTYHVDNIPRSDLAYWKSLPSNDVRSWTQCEECGLTETEIFELTKVGRDTLLGNYGTNQWTSIWKPDPAAPKIGWSGAAHPLITFIPPYDTSDTTAREAFAQLGYRAFSASAYEESGGLAPYLSPEGSHMNAFDQFGMFHASAMQQVTPSDVAHLSSIVQPGDLNTFLIEEVDWSTRDSTGASNDKVNMAVWPQWLQLLDFVNSYPDSVTMTAGEVALARAFDNAPTVANPSQADGNHDGIGDVIDGSHFVTDGSGSVGTAALHRGDAGAVQAQLVNGSGTGIPGQTVTFSFDANGDGTVDSFTGTTGSDGTVSAPVTATAPPGDYSFTASWDGGSTTATGTGTVSVTDTTELALDAANPTSGQVTDEVTVSGTLTNTHGGAVAGRGIDFTIGGAHGSGITDASGVAQATLTLTEPGETTILAASFAGDSRHQATSASAAFTVNPEDTSLTLDGDNPASGAVADSTTVGATLLEADGQPVAGRTLTFTVGDAPATTALTNASGYASATVTLTGPAQAQAVHASFVGDSSYLASTADPGSIDVARGATSLTLDAAPLSGRPTTSVDVGATLTDANGPLGGRTVEFALAGETASTVTDADGHAGASLTVTGTSGDLLTLSASFAQDDSYLVSYASRDFTAVDRTPTLVLDSDNPASAEWGGSIPVGATLTGDDGNPLVGASVTLRIGSGTPAVSTTDSNGYAAATLTVPTTGSTLRASFAGDSAYVPVEDSTAFSILRRDPVLALSSSNPASGQMGSTATFAATLTGFGGVALVGADVTISIGAASQTISTNGTGQATATLTLPTSGSAVTAAFAGDSLYRPASDTHAFSITKRSASVTVDTTNPVSGQLTDTVSFGATLRDQAGSAITSGTMTMTLGTATPVTATTNSSGHATWTVSLTGANGARSLSFGFAGDAIHTGVTTTASTFTVNKETSVLTAPTSVTSGKGGKFTVAVTLRDDDNQAIAGRTVQLLTTSGGRQVLAQGTTSASGQVTISGTVNKNRTALTVSFAGDGTYLGATKPLTVN